MKQIGEQLSRLEGRTIKSVTFDLHRSQCTISMTDRSRVMFAVTPEGKLQYQMETVTDCAGVLS